MLNEKLLGASVLALSAALTGTANANENSLKIGYITGLSGACSGIAEDGLNGSKHAVEELNAKGGILGRQIELVIRDSQTKPDEGGKQARELLASENVDVLTRGLFILGVACGRGHICGSRYAPLWYDRVDPKGECRRVSS